MGVDGDFKTQRSTVEGVDEAAELFFNNERAKQERARKVREAAGVEEPRAPEGAPEAGADLTTEERINLASGAQVIEDPPASEDAPGEPNAAAPDQPGGEELDPEGEQAQDEPEGSEITLDTQVELSDGSQVSIAELRDGHMRQQDYTAKTTELSQQRELFEQKVAEAHQVYETRIGEAVQLSQQLQAHMANFKPDPAAMERLRVSDPGEYAARMEDMRTKQTLIAQTAQRQQAAQAEAQKRVDQQRAARVPIERKALAETLPAFRKDFDGEYDAVTRYVLASDGGRLRPEEWDLVDDHRYVTLVWKAREYDRATRKTAPVVRKKLADSKPRSVRSGRRREAGESASDDYKKAMANLASNPESRRAQEDAFIAKERAKRQQDGSGRQTGRT